MNRKQKTIRARQRRIHTAAFVLLAIVSLLILPAALCAMGASPEASLAAIGLFGAGRILLSPRGHESGGAMTDEEFQSTVLKAMETVEEKSHKTRDDIDALKRECNNLAEKIARHGNSIRNFNPTGPRQKGFISDDAAAAMAAAVVVHATKSGKVENLIRDSRQRDSIFDEIKSLTGITTKAMTTAEIPLPVEYGRDLIELIAEFGVARREFMPYPMSGGQNRPPRWGTRPQFGAISMSQQIPEKKPKLEFCDLTSKKLGGIVITPSEIDSQSLVSMGQFLAQYGAKEFALAEDTWAFLADGTETYEGVEGLCKIAKDNEKYIALGAGKTKPSDVTLDDFRAIRRKVNTAALSGGKYYLNQTWEGFLRSFNTINDPQIFVYRPDGTATLDGFPIVWTEVLQPYQDVAAAGANLAVFGRLKFWLFGQRGFPRVDTSEHAFFIYDQLATRFLEELDFDYLSIEAAATLQTAEE